MKKEDFNLDEYNYLTYRCIAKKPVLDTVVKWTWIENNGETLLSLEHSGFKGSQFMTKMMLQGGWKKMMEQHLYEKLTK